MKARLDAKDKEYEEKEAESHRIRMESGMILNRDGSETEFPLDSSWRPAAGVSTSHLELYFPGIKRAREAAEAREAAKVRLGKPTPKSVSRYQQRMREVEARRIQTVVATKAEEIKDIHRMAKDLKRKADLTELVMKRLDHYIEEMWADIRKNTAAVMKRIHVDRAVRPRKTAGSIVKVENNRNLRDAMGFRLGIEPSYEEEHNANTTPVRTHDAAAWKEARHGNPAPVHIHNASGWKDVRRSMSAAVRTRKSFAFACKEAQRAKPAPARTRNASVWDQAHRAKPAPMRFHKASVWEEARHVKPPPVRYWER